MSQLASIVSYLDKLLNPGSFADSAFNGLQVESPRSDIRKVALAVDAGLSVIERAISEDANLLIVHHGILWDQLRPISGIFGKKIELLLRSRMSLYASHLPLDAHDEVGNAFELGRFMEIQNLTRFFEYKGQMIGALGRLPKPRLLDYFVEKASEITGAISPLVLPYGKNEIQTVGIVTGSGASAMETCVRDGVDLLISGEPRHEVFHICRENKINALFAGHYATETFGVSAVGKRLARDFDLDTIFIDEPSGI